MIVQKIKIFHFKSIYEPLEIDFQNLKGFWKVSGGVGSGKTTLGEAILFGLFGSVNGKNNADLISWGYKSGCIEVWCLSKGKSIYIKRDFRTQGQSPLYVEVEGNPIVFTNKRDAQQQLEQEYFDTSRLMVELLCIISLKNFKSLATLNKADTKAFLDQVFGFFVLTNYSDVCKEFLSEIESNKKDVTVAISNIDSQIRKIEELASIERIEGNLNDIKESLKEYNNNLDNTAAEATNVMTQYSVKIKELQNELTKIKTMGSAKSREIDFIKKGVCPTCGAPIDQSQLAIKEEERDTLRKSYSLIDGQLKELNEQYKKDVEVINKKKQDLLIEKNELVRKQIRLEEQESRATINTQEIDSLNMQKREEQDELNQLLQEQTQWETLKSILVGEVRQRVLSAFIPRLNTNIQEYSNRLQLPYIIEFDESFSCYIKMGGFDKIIPTSSLSTGQLKTVDLCIVLGVIKTILNSVAFNITLLDELISNMDSELRQTVCQVLKNSIEPNQTMFIISHTELDDKWFDGSIDVEIDHTEEFQMKSKYTIKNR